jgi:DNA-binding LacI/PurR family transcriptional regulator
MKIQPLFPRPQTVSQQIAEIIRRGLADGVWRGVLPGEIELSRTLQVSRTTLRASLATLTAEGILSVSAGGRKRTVLVRPTGGSKRRASRLIVLLTAVPIEHMTMLHILQVDGLRKRFLQDGFVLEVHANPAVFAGQPARRLERLTAHLPAAAWILLNSSAWMQQWFMAQQLPCVVIGATHSHITIPSLGSDYRAIGHHAAGVFLRRGHRQLALIVPDDGKAGHRNTEEGFRAGAALTNGASVQIIRHTGKPDALARSLLAMRKYSPATGLLVALPQFYLTVMSALASVGIRVPQDVSTLARDSDAYMDFMIPSPARYVINVQHYVKKISQTVLLVARGGMPRVREQLLQRDFVLGQTIGHLSEK